jgi:protein-tyrosine-phosphatase
MNILFVCKYNRFRSKVAEAYFKEINKNKNIQAKSAGIFIGSKLSSNQIKAAKYFGIKISGKPQGISTDLLKWQDAIILVSNDIPSVLFKNNKKYGKKLIVWKISDAGDNDKKNIERIIKSIMFKVDKLIEGLNKK